MQLTAIGRRLRKALTVSELIDELRCFPPDATVVFGTDYGDHCHTEQALPVTTIDELDAREVLTESGYSKSGVAIESLRDEDSASNEVESNSNQLGCVVVLR